MESLTISLPESMKTFLEEQVSEGRFRTISDFIRQLVSEAQKQKARERVEALLQEGIDSGESTPVTDQDWEDHRRRLRERLAKRNAS